MVPSRWYPGDPEAIRGPRAARGVRSAQWGLWTLAPIVSRGSQVGYGVFCGYHVNTSEPHIDCKRQLMFGTRDPLSHAQCRAKLKKWLLCGLSIRDHKCARKEHMDILPRSLDTDSETELDRQAAALVQEPQP
jgi:hypothetical protein